MSKQHTPGVCRDCRPILLVQSDCGHAWIPTGEVELCPLHRNAEKLLEALKKLGSFPLLSCLTAKYCFCESETEINLGHSLLCKYAQEAICAAEEGREGQEE